MSASQPALTPAALPRRPAPESLIDDRRVAGVALVLAAALLASTAGWLWSPAAPLLRLAFAALTLLLWGAALVALWWLLRQAREATGSLRRFAVRVGRADLLSVLDSHRDTGFAPTSLGNVADGVAQALDERERRWAARARLSADWTWETDTELRWSWVSDDLKSHLKLGLKPEDLIGKRHDEVAHYQPPEGGWGRLNERMRLHKAFRDVEIEVRRPGRSSVWIALSARPRRDANGRFMGYEGVGRDVTEHRLAFRRLQESERRYAVIADLSADWYWETDAEHRFSFVGSLAHELLGEVAAQSLGHHRWELHAGGASAEAWARHRTDLDARRPFRRFEYVIRRAGRPAVWVLISGQPRHDAKGTFLGYQGVGRDVTLRKRAEKVLLTRNAQLERLVAERTAELERSNRDLEAFSRQLAHELRTPLGHVVAFADLLAARAGGRLDDEERGWLALQATSARAMADTVTALLELARSGATELVREPVDLTALATELAAELPAGERRAPLTWRIEPGLQARCSAPLLRLVLSNLLSNGAKFTRDVEAPRVEFRPAGEQDGVPVWCVADNGAGFDHERAAALFAPFVRLHDARDFPGTGVGLSIVRRIVERHGGWVRARSAPGEGASFEFTLAAPAEAGENTDDAAGPLA